MHFTLNNKNYATITDDTNDDYFINDSIFYTNLIHILIMSSNVK